jgi:hypothetical protein
MPRVVSAMTGWILRSRWNARAVWMGVGRVMMRSCPVAGSKSWCGLLDEGKIGMKK